MFNGRILQHRITVLIYFCIILIAVNIYIKSYVDNRIRTILINWFDSHQTDRNVNTFKEYNPDKNNLTQLEMQEIIDEQREAIIKDMKNYVFPTGHHSRNVSELNNLIIEKGGQPIRNVIVTTWRSGSTFLSEIITANPNTFYFPEPLQSFGSKQIRGFPDDKLALSNIYGLFNCNYNKLNHYLHNDNRNFRDLHRNIHVWQHCQKNEKFCWNTYFVASFCKLFPFQTMKFARLRLNVAENLLIDEKLGVRIVFLIRDPRAVMLSRKIHHWCSISADCIDPILLCADMVSNYKSAVQLVKKYPLKFTVIRYEDLCLNPFDNVKRIYEFYGLNFDNNTVKFLEAHTNYDIEGVWSTHRKSQETVLNWRNNLNFKETMEIQSVCKDALNLWGYVLALNETHQKTFNPVTNYTIEN